MGIKLGVIVQNAAAGVNSFHLAALLDFDLFLRNEGSVVNIDANINHPGGKNI